MEKCRGRGEAPCDKVGSGIDLALEGGKSFIGPMYGSKKGYAALV